jgi:hypothetical protein
MQESDDKKQSAGQSLPAHQLVRKAFEANDDRLFMSRLADDAVLHSPWVSRTFELRGPKEVVQAFRLMNREVKNKSFTAELVGTEATSLAFDGYIGDEFVQVMILLQTDDRDQIVDLTVHLRPFTGLSKLGMAFADGFTRPHSRFRAAWLGAALKALHIPVRAADWVAIRVIKDSAIHNASRDSDGQDR